MAEDDARRPKADAGGRSGQDAAPGGHRAPAGGDEARRGPPDKQVRNQGADTPGADTPKVDGARRNPEKRLREFAKDGGRSQFAPQLGAELNNSYLRLVVNGGNVVFGGRQGSVGGGVGAFAGHFGGQATFEPGPVTADEFAGIVGAYARPERFADIVRALTDRHVAMVQAPTGWGRTAAALNALHAVAHTEMARRAGEKPTSDPEYRRLEPDTEIHHLDPGTFAADTGHVLDPDVLVGAAGLRSHHLERLARGLQQKNAWLVIVADDRTVFGDPLTGFRVDCGRPPPALEVVAEHYARVSGLAISECRSRLAEYGEIDMLVTAICRDGHSASGLAMLGERLAMDKSGPEIQAWVDGLVSTRFVEWARGYDSLEQRALLLTLGVLADVPYSAVSRAALDLEKRLLARVRAADRPPRPLFPPDRSIRLADARAEIVNELRPTYYGPAQVEVVRFRDPTYPARVLDWVWHEQDVLHPAFLEWLCHLAGDPDPVVRARVATAIGLLSTWSFEEIRRAVLLPLADTCRTEEIETAALALRVPATSRDFLPLVVEMLADWGDWTGWLDDADLPGRLWAAMRAWGSGVGPLDLERALRRLRELADIDGPVDLDTVVSMLAISNSVLELFDHKMPDENVTTVLTRQIRVLKELRIWTDDGEPISRRRVGALSFIQLLLDLDTPRDPADPWAPTRPLLLMMSEQHQEILQRVGLLWHRAFNTSYLRSASMESLRYLVGRAARDEAIQHALVGAVRGSVRTEDDFDRISGSLPAWQKKYPRPVGALLAMLEEIKASER